MSLALPVGLQLLVGAALIFYALHGWDAKYHALGGALSGEGAPSDRASLGGEKNVGGLDDNTVRVTL